MLLQQSLLAGRPAITLTVCPGVELELVRDGAPSVVVPGLDLGLVHGVGHELLEDVGLVVLEAPRAHAVDDDVVVRVVDVLAGVVLQEMEGMTHSV